MADVHEEASIALQDPDAFYTDRGEDRTMRKFQRCLALAKGLRARVREIHADRAAEELGDMLFKELDDLFGLLSEGEE